VIATMGTPPAFLGAVTADKMTWYLSRSSGMVAWMLVTASVVWGLLLSAKVLNKRASPAWMLDLHRFLGGTAVTLVAVHLAALVADNYAHFGWRQILIPFTPAERAEKITTAVAWGVIAMYLLIAVEATSLLRRRLPKKVWRRVHYLSFPLYVLCTWHGFQAGTDRNVRLFGIATVVCVALTTVLTIVRIVVKPKRNGRLSRPIEDDFAALATADRFKREFEVGGLELMSDEPRNVEPALQHR
jgi:DMSO/TMAO reductase YedYZ heme-binding membrane subunit